VRRSRRWPLSARQHPRLSSSRLRLAAAFAAQLVPPSFSINEAFVHVVTCLSRPCRRQSPRRACATAVFDALSRCTQCTFCRCRPPPYAEPAARCRCSRVQLASRYAQLVPSGGFAKPSRCRQRRVRVRHGVFCPLNTVVRARRLAAGSAVDVCTPPSFVRARASPVPCSAARSGAQGSGGRALQQRSHSG
jgi:hypothetical protein